MVAAKIKILYVDEDQNALTTFSRLLGAESPYDIRLAESATAALKALAAEQDIRLVMAGFQLPEMTGVEFLGRVAEQLPAALQVICPELAERAAVAEAISTSQIYSSLPKPWDEEELKLAITTLLHHQELQQLNIRLNQELQAKNEQLEAINENLEQMVIQRTEALEIRNRVLQISQGVLDVMPVAVLGIDAEQMIVQCNEFARELFPAGFMGPLGGDRREIFPAEINQVVDRIENERTPAARVVLKGRSLRAEVRRLHETLSQGVVLVLIPD